MGKKMNVRCICVYSILLLITAGCQPPLKFDPMTSKQEGRGSGKKAAPSEKNTSQTHADSQGKKKPAQPEQKEEQKKNGKKSSKKEAYQTLPLPKSLSREPEDVKEDIIAEKPPTITAPVLNGAGTPVCYEEREVSYRIAAAFDDNIILDPSSSVIYPGAVLAGEGIDTASYTEITRGIKRPAVLSFSLQGVKDKSGKPGIVSGSVVPGLAEYRKFHNEVLSQKIDYTASASSSYEEIVIKNESAFDAQFKLGVGFSAAGIKAKIGAGFKFKDGDNKHRHLIRFTEVFYTVDVNQEDTPLMTDIPYESLGSKMPVYVSSVSYGRIAYLSIESDKTWEEIKTDIDLVLKPKPHDGELEIKNAIKRLNENTVTTITIIGGYEQSVTTLTEFRKYIVKGGFASKNPGQIIKYKLRFLGDDARAHIKYQENYTTVHRTELACKGIRVSAALTEFENRAEDYGNEGEYFGTIGIRSQTKTYTEQLLFDQSRNKPLIINKRQRIRFDDTHKDYAPQKTIEADPASPMLDVLFNINERNFNVGGGDQSFILDRKALVDQPAVLSIADLQKRPVQTFTLYKKTKPDEYVTVKILFKVAYTF